MPAVDAASIMLRDINAGDDAVSVGGLDNDIRDSVDCSDRQQQGTGFPNMVEGIAFEERFGFGDRESGKSQIGQGRLASPNPFYHRSSAIAGGTYRAIDVACTITLRAYIFPRPWGALRRNVAGIECFIRHGSRLPEQ
jgi:hypothetical protein